MLKRFFALFKKDSPTTKTITTNQEESSKRLLPPLKEGTNRMSSSSAFIKESDNKAVRYYFTIEQSGIIEDQIIDTGFSVEDNQQLHKYYNQTERESHEK